MIIEDFKPFLGEHCETTAVGNLLKHNGILLSEPMLFGIGEGISFIYWDGKQMEYPFLGGRCREDAVTKNIVQNLKLSIDVNETSSCKKAWEYVKSNIDQGIPTALKLDCYYLEYFTDKFHFAAHYVTMYGYDKSFGYLIDTIQQGMQMKSSLSSIADARNAKGPMSSRNRAFSITKTQEQPNLKSIIVAAIRNNAKIYLNPSIQNLSFKGIRKASRLITKWLDKQGITPENITLVGVLMERGGTGGALFRNMYRDFLKECDDMFPELNFHEAYINFAKIAPMWTEVSKLICSAGKNASEKQLKEASDLLMEISFMEEDTIKML